MNHIIFIMGVAGSGKTTIGLLISSRTGLPFFDGDDFHPPHNKEKMKGGHPLNDEDREQWLQRLNELAIKQSTIKGAVIACSALKEKYRVILSSAVEQTHWIFLEGSYEIIYQRIQKRSHFMPAGLLRSQFDILETPASSFTVDIKHEPAKIVELIVEYLNQSEQEKPAKG